jgi:hypothetical protein
VKINQEISSQHLHEVQSYRVHEGGNEYVKMLSCLDIIVLDIFLDANDNPP